MITVEWIGYKFTKTKLDNTYVLVDKLREAGFELPENFQNTHWMKMFNKLNRGIKIYLSINPFESEVHEMLELIWSSNRERLEERISLLADDI